MSRFTWVLLAAICFVPQSLFAALLASEAFTYPDAGLATNNGGSGFSTAWGNANGNNASSGLVTVSSNQASYGAGSGNHLIFRGLTTPFPASGDIWMSLDFVRSGGSFNGLQLFTGTSEKFLVGGASTTAVWTLGKNGGSGTPSTVASNAMKTGVIHFTLDSGNLGTADLWVGAGVGAVDISGAPAVSITGLTLTGVDTVRIGSSGGQFIDNLLIGTTSADVNAAPIPEPSTIVLTALGLVMAGMFRFGKKRTV